MQSAQGNKRTTTKDAARGRWHGIMSYYGLTDKQLSGKHSPCPNCNGKDRFRFTDRGSGDYFCSGCSPGDGFDLVMKITGLSFGEVAKEIDDIVGNIKQEKIKMPDTDKAAALLKRISGELTPIDDNTKAYLKYRGVPACSGMRSHPGLTYYEDGKPAGKYPAMVTRFLTSNGTLSTYHVTYLQDGKKAPVSSPKKIMPVCQPMAGGALRLTPVAEHMGITEGVETALACMDRFVLPVWASSNTAMLEAFETMQGIKSIIVFADNDANFAGQKSAYILANRLALQGVKVDVLIPPHVGDWNDKINGGSCQLNGGGYENLDD